MKEKVRVRFAPSPTGPLHIGGVRTALYNYLFAKKEGGVFILRIEDTDQTRYAPGAEKHIIESLNWLGLKADEGVGIGGEYGPYRQSERKKLYQENVQKLLDNGTAYYAFDSPNELEEMRLREKEAGNYTPKYDHRVRMTMKNSLTLSVDEVNEYLSRGEHVTVRMKVPENEEIFFRDTIRGVVTFESRELDDKVILKADGLPTYHLANVVDDKNMKISHVIRGEEWLSSTAHHVLLYRSFGWEEEIPVFAHLPLILKPSGKGKLSKRDGAKFGFPVFPMDWHDEKEAVTFDGFKETGFLPDALLNFLVLLGWNPGTDEEIFDINRLIELFDLHQINKSGAQFNYEKAKWFNQQYINHSDIGALYQLIREEFKNEDEAYILSVIKLMQPRVTLLSEFKSSSTYFFSDPIQYDEKSLAKKYKSENKEHFEKIAGLISTAEADANKLQDAVKGYINENSLKFGAILAPLRIFITGSMSGPDLFEMMALIGNEQCASRIIKGILKAEAING